MNTSFKILFGLLGFSFLVWACSTEKNTFMNRAFHNLNSKYNGLFNANEIYNESLTSFGEQFKDNYEEILPLEVFPDETQAKNFTQDMEKVIEKCETVIAKHSMPNPYRTTSSKEEEHCKWIDETWLQISKSHFVLRHYKDAKDRLEFVSNFYRGDKSSYEARIWLSKIHVMNREYSSAMILLKELDDLIERQAEEAKQKKEKTKKKKKKSKFSKKKKKKKEEKQPDKFPKKLLDDFYIAKAHYYIQKEEYKDAIESIEKALEFKVKSKQRARYHYILGQLYQRMGNSDKAVDQYSACLKKNADYTMQFYAKINGALASGINGGEKLKKGLKKMLKDEKNEEFKDQIYYALADIALKENDKDLAIDYLNKSIESSINNNRQLAKTHLKLGDIYFKDKNYIDAQENYAAAAEVMPEDFPNYEGVKNKADGLLELVTNVRVVELEDSLQMIAGMDDSKRYEFLQGVIEDIQEQERIRKEEEKAKLLAQQEKVNSFNQTMGGSGAKFWVYNAKLRSDGLSEFRRNWGNRTLEDNWRRTNKSTIKTDLGLDNSTEDLDTNSVQEDTMSVEMFLVDLPLTDAAIDSSNSKIVNALYNLGNIYKNDLFEEKLAIESFKNILDRKIEHELVLPAAYQLYRIYSAKNKPEADQYKNFILNNHPNSDYANVIRDPNFFKDQLEKLSDDEEAYSKLVDRYRNKMYGLVIAKCNRVIQTDTANNFLPKYYLLKAYAIGKTSQNTESSLRSPLEELVEKFPGTPEAAQAQKLLDRLGKINEIKAATDSIVSSMVYDENLNQIQYFMIVTKTEMDDNAMKVKLSNFNRKYFKNSDLSVTSSILKGVKQIYLVSPFQTKEEAMDFLRAFNSDTELFSNKANLDYFVISKTNFTKLYIDKDVEHYLEFFNEKYK